MTPGRIAPRATHREHARAALRPPFADSLRLLFVPALSPSLLQVSLEMLEQLPPYEELRGLEEKLRFESKLTFDSIFNEPTGYYMIKCQSSDHTAEWNNAACWLETALCSSACVPLH